MVCPNCATQLIQYKQIGGGDVDSDYYDTSEIKECKKCEKLFVEYYVTFEINDSITSHIDRILRNIQRLLKGLQL